MLHANFENAVLAVFRLKTRINAEILELLEAQLKSDLGKQTKIPNPLANPSLFLWHQFF